ncbi:MAG: DUF2156 domain-containing protein [Candidatus Nealsonbacteria bacterium]|nr:DUF2156 domain-containing protein [Candidatus Nealsonbacteria bacterium]
MTIAHEVPHRIHQGEMSLETAALMERYAFDYGQTYDSYLVTEAGREYFWSSGRRGVVGFLRRGRHVHVMGGLLAAEEHREMLLREFTEFTSENRLTATFHNLPHGDLRLFRRHGFQTSKFGEEPIVRLDQTCWQGKSYEWVRRQENYCVRQGVCAEEIAADPNDTEYRRHVVAELEDLNREHLAETLHARELQFFQGKFKPLELGRRRIFVARQDRRIVAFVVCNPGLGGNFWAIETYRRRNDAPRGVVPYLMMQVMRQLKEEGVAYCSLSLMPFVRCWPPIDRESVILPFVCGFWWRRMNWLFDVRGIYHYKSRFRPHYREMFLATHPKITCRSLIATAATWKLFEFNPLQLARHAWDLRRRGARRRTLSEPSPRPDRVIRELRAAAIALPEAAKGNGANRARLRTEAGSE